MDPKETSRFSQIEVGDAPKAAAETPAEEGVRRIPNPYADTKTTESKAGLYPSNRKMAERRVFDYSHHLIPAARKLGFAISVYHHPNTKPAPPFAEVTQNGIPYGVRVWGHGPQGMQPLRAAGPQRYDHPYFANIASAASNALYEHAENHKKTVASGASGFTQGRTPFLDSLELPADGSRFQQLEVKEPKKRRKKLPHIIENDPIAARASQLEIGDTAPATAKETSPEAAGPKPYEGSRPGQFTPDLYEYDYSHRLPDYHQKRGYKLVVRAADKLDRNYSNHSYLLDPNGRELVNSSARRGPHYTRWGLALARANNEHRDHQLTQAYGDKPLPRAMSQSEWEGVKSFNPRSYPKLGLELNEGGHEYQGYDYSNLIPEHLRGEGRRLHLYHNPRNSNMMQVRYVDRNGVGIPGIGGYSITETPWRSRELGMGWERPAIEAFRQHQHLINSGKLEGIGNQPKEAVQEPSRFSQLELSEKDPYMTKSEVLKQILVWGRATLAKAQAMSKSEKTKGPHHWLEQFQILDPTHVDGLERDAAINEFGSKLPRDEAEKKAYDDYVTHHRKLAAAHHFAGVKGAKATGNMDAARKHGVMFEIHMKALGHNPMEALPPEIKSLLQGNDSKLYNFKASKGDLFALNDHKSDGAGESKDSKDEK